MTEEDLLSRLDGVHRSGRGWIVRCPAHDDRTPSLHVREGEDGRMLLHCFGGCSIHAICEALGIRVSDLFPGATRRLSVATVPCQRRRDWREVAASFQQHADGLMLRAESVLNAARGLDLSNWTDQDRDAAMKAVCRAYRDLERSETLEGVAFKLRLCGLKQERERDASHRHAA